MWSDFISFFGSYEPCVTVLSDGTEVVSANWGYLGMCLLVTVFVYCLLRFVGGLFIRWRDK